MPNSKGYTLIELIVVVILIGLIFSFAAPKFRDAVAPVFTELYESVVSGKEVTRTLDKNSQPDYREKLQEELDVIRNSEMWQAGAAVRSLRPENREFTKP